tara:strand:- start:90 stop:896 length:807 start_codon:yes stop_codon:yes gene_type:complete
VLLQVDKISFGYRQKSIPNNFTLRDISLKIKSGSLTGLIGPNGCGKTTLLTLMAGIQRPQNGKVTLDDEPLTNIAKRKIAQRIAIVPQETHPAFDYTVLEMALMGRHPYLKPFTLEGPTDIEIAYDALTVTGTDHLANRPYMTLSGGEKQRVIIASALTQSPDLLLLDEPTASLDLGYQIEISLLLKKLNRERNMTLVVATHDLNMAASLCENLVLMHNGKILAQGLTQEVLTADMVRQLYGVEASVKLQSETGDLLIVPVRRKDTSL